MTAKRSGAGVAGFPRLPLVREDWVYLLCLLLPLVVYDVTLKVVRVAGLPETPGILGFVDQTRSELFFGLGWAALWVGIFGVARRGVGRLLALVLFHVAVVADVALTTGAHYFYEATGSVLDYDLVALAAAEWRQTWAIAATETTSAHWALLSVVLFYALAGPSIVTLLFVRRGDPRQRPRPHSRPHRTGGVRFAPAAVPCLAAAALGALSLIPSGTGESKSFARDPLANMLVAEFDKLELGRSGLETGFGGSPPSDATLTGSPGSGRNVVMVFLESTRASATTPYNEALGTTPFLAELAEDSLLVENAYAVVPHTSKALAAGHCGVVPPLDAKNTEAEPGAIPARCLPDLLKEQGYATAFFQSATKDFERRGALVENLGHEDFFPLETMSKEGFEAVNYFGYEDDVMLEPSRAWLEEQRDAGSPFMASYLTVTPHHDYVVPQRYGVEEFDEDERLNNYLNTVRYQDFFLKNLFEQYKELGLYEDTIFVVLGDHGEGFGEHDRWQHDRVIYEEGLKIPLLIHDPGNFLLSGTRVEEPATQLDLLPTLADLLGYEVTAGYPGGRLLSLPEDRPIVASCYYERNCLASIRGEEKYIHHFGDQEDELFDLANDPLERSNLAGKKELEALDARREELLDWLSAVNATYETR